MSDQIDVKLRELTYRLIEMTPAAPPFPEEPMAQLKPSPTPASPARRRSPLVWAGAAAAIALVVVGVPLLLLRGTSTTPATTVPPATAVTVPDAVTPTTTPPTTPGTTVVPDTGTTLEFSVYLLSNELTTPVGDPMLVPVQFTRPGFGGEVPEVAIALDALLTADEVPAGYSTAIPEDLGWAGSLEGTNQVVVSLPPKFESGGGTALMTARLAQVVFTATQVPGVDSVVFKIDGEVVDVFSGEGIVLDGPQTRDDYFGTTDQLIYLDSPAIGSTVGSPITISGSANTFEANVVYEVTTADGTVLASGFTTATCGSGCWGAFSASFPYVLEEDTAGFVTVYEESAEDGSRQNVVTYEVMLAAAA